MMSKNSDSFLFMKMPPNEIGLFWSRTNMSQSPAHSVDTTMERGADGGGSFTTGENIVMNRRVW